MYKASRPRRRDGARWGRRFEGWCPEPLEGRALLTIIYNPVFGPETTSQDDSEHMSQPDIFLVFWGSYWTSTAGAAQMTAVTNTASAVVTSTFPLITNQYGADGANMSIKGTVIDSSDPNGGSFDEDSIDDVVQNQIDNGPLPESDTGRDDHTKIYVVVTPPTVASKYAGVAGFNSVESDIDFGDVDDIGECWVWGGTQTDGTVNLDQFSVVFSHEVAEIMTDFDGEGYEVNQPPGAPGGSGGQIGDYEGNGYRFRMSNGVVVQPLWSRKDNAWAVTDGTSQNFFLDGAGNWTGNTKFNGKFALTLRGDQAGLNDSFLVGTAPSGGVQVTQNGETINFDPGQITGITIAAGGGANTVSLNPLPGGVTLSMSAAGGTIQLIGPNSPNAWLINGPGSGTLDGFSFASVTSVMGGSGPDTFTLAPGGSLAGTLDGGGGSNTLDYSSAGGPVAVNLQASTATAIGVAVSNIGSFLGSSASDTLIGPDLGSVWTIAGANSGTVAGVSFASFENLVGGSLADRFAFNPGGSLSGNLSGGGGVNTLDDSALFGPVSVDLQTGKATAIGGTFAGFSKFFGGLAGDTLTGPDAPSIWYLTGADSGNVSGATFVSFETLVGGASDDTFAFQPGGSVSGDIAGGGGANTLDYSALAGPVTVNFTTQTATGIGGTFSHINAAIGSAGGNDTIVGPDAAWIISGLNSGSVNGIAFSSFENLTGGPAADTFTFLPAGAISGNLDGGLGNNVLDLSNLAGPVVVNLQTGKAPGIGGTFANLTGLVGTPASDTLIGPDSPSLWTIAGANAGSVNAIAFSSFENLTGGASADTFAFQPGGSVSGNIAGGGGANTLDYSAVSSTVTLDLAASKSTGIGGTFSGITGFVGGSGPNVVVGPSGPATWSITGPNTVSVAGFTIAGFPSITGGPSDDVFAFKPGGSLSGTLDGGGGVNTLDDSARPGSLTVNLRLGTATGVGGGIAHIRDVKGGLGDSLIVGDAQPNTLTGGGGRSLIIGGAGADRIVGGAGDSLLIAGTTAWDLNALALASLMDEWSRTDLAFEKRVEHLMTGKNGALNGSTILDKSTVYDDAAPDSLTGGGGLDWFFVSHFDDTVLNRKPKDHITNLK